MQLHDINNLKEPLKNGEIIELSSDTDIVQLFIKETLGGSSEFIIELNAKIISMNKRFRTFRDKVWKLVQERNLEINQ